MAHPTSNTDAKKLVTRDVLINIRAKKRQRDLIDQAARALGKNRSDFMLETACREAEAVLLDRRVFPLDKETWKRFNALLDAPVREVSLLRRLLTAKPPWEQ